METLMEALIDGTREQQIQAALELRSLTTKQKHKLVERGMIAPLVSMLNSCDYKAIEAALLALLTLAYGSERNKTRIAKSGAIPALLAVLTCQSTALVELSVSNVFILSSCTSNKLAIASSGAIPLLVEFLLQIIHGWEKSSELVEKATALLEKIVSSSDPALRITAATGGALQGLVEAVEDGTSQCKEHAVGILLLICQT